MENDKFTFPPKLLEQVNECSKGGYILFTIDSDGLPEVHSRFDDPTKAMALQYYIDNWTKAMEALNVDLTTRSMLESEDSMEDEDPPAEEH